MAAFRGRGQQGQIGSHKWVYDERTHANELVDQAIEEFTFAARDEVDWLNAHMAEIFSTNEFNVADVFKTPGKLKGKTPRTARKANPLEDRAPLSDVFSARKQPAPSPTRLKTDSKHAPPFILAEDKENYEVEAIPQSRFSTGVGKENAADSGYHDSTDNETEAATAVNTQETPTRPSPQKIATPLGFLQPTPQRIRNILQVETDRRSRSYDSFVSAKEQNSDQNTPRASQQPPTHDIKSAIASPRDSAFLGSPPKAILPEGLTTKPASLYHVSAETTAGLHHAFEQVQQKQQAEDIEKETDEPEDADKSSASEVSSPERPALRKKSSLNFASLPAREPLQMKKSMGASVSRTSQFDLAKTRESRLDPPPVEAEIVEQNSQDDLSEKSTVDEESQDEIVRQISEDENSQPDSATKIMHSKTSTQRLHDRITMLSKLNSQQPARAPIPSFTVPKRKSQESAKATYEAETQADLPKQVDDGRINSARDVSHETVKSQKQSMPGAFYPAMPSREPTVEAENPIKSRTSEIHLPQDEDQPVLPKRSSKRLSGIRPAEIVAAAEERLEDRTPKRPKTAYPQLHSTAIESTTPAGSPVAAKHFEGPLSASKAKLYSVFQTARGIFASSAGTSAQAKLEARPPPSRGVDAKSSPERVKTDESQANTLTPTRSLYPDIESAKAGLKESKKPPAQAQTETVRVVRRSSERLRKRSHEIAFQEPEQQVSSDEAEKPPVPAKDDVAPTKTPSSEMQQATEDQQSQFKDEMPPPPPPKSSSRMQPKTTEARRPVKAQIKGAAQKNGPASVPIMLASQKIGPNPQQSSQTSSQASTLVGSQDPPGPPPPPKEPGLVKKQSTASLKSQTSSQSFKSSASSRPKALEAAARKKEEQEKEAQRKAEQKRELERRRAEKLENEKKAAEHQKAMAQKAAAQKQMADRQRAEAAAMARKEQQARTQTQAQVGGSAAGRIRQVEDTNSNFNRNGYDGSRPASRDAPTRPPLPHINPAKPPPKRQYPGDGDDDQFEFARVNKSGPPTEKKQRMTREPSPEEPQQQQRPTMAPPVRMSAIRKEQTSRFTPGYMSQAGTSYTSHSTFKASTQALPSQSQQNPKTPHMHDMAKYSNARIPFAAQSNHLSQSNTSGPGSSYHQQALQHSARSAQHSKTPLTANSHRSSPTQYPNGDNISLPEIATDSEDSDAGDDFDPPDWANSPALRELLRQQQLVDPMKVFGPIAPLIIEEVFKNGDKSRMKKFRDRTSSANWNGVDRLTEEERRRDFEAREKIERDGGWTFDPAV